MFKKGQKVKGSIEKVGRYGQGLGVFEEKTGIVIDFLESQGIDDTDLIKVENMETKRLELWIFENNNVTLID